MNLLLNSTKASMDSMEQKYTAIVKIKDTEIERLSEIALKSNNSYLYCCNREKKILPDGETVEFRKYPFGNPTIIVEEECPWTSKYYDYHKYPFIFKYETTLHTLVKYNDSK